MNGIDNPLLTLADVLNFSQAIAKKQELPTQLKIILRGAQKIASAEAGCIYLLDKTQRFLVPKLCIGNPLERPNVSLANVELNRSNKDNLANICAYCAISGQLVSVENIYAYSGFDFSAFYSVDNVTGQRTRSVLAVPLTDYDNVCTGVMLLFNHQIMQEDSYNVIAPELENLIKGFAAIAAISISNSLLMAEKQDLLRQQDELNASLIDENKELKGRIYKSLQLDQIIGSSPAMQQVYGLIEKVASSTATVFLNGETGTGKELFAATVHQNSPMRKGKFIAQNCAAFPPDLLESEMFGYHKGAFSGATVNKKGLFEEAHNGTLFLDEIGEMPMPLQSKLLRVLQEGEVRPLGSNVTVKVNVRIIAATNRALLDMVSEGTFREDLYYRLNVFPIRLPSLRERASDIPVLTHYFINKYAKQYGKQIKQLDPKAMDFLQSYAFPGNVRELQNIIERAVILAGDGNVISFDCLPPELKDTKTSEVSVANAVGSVNSLKDSVAQFEAEILRSKLAENGGNQTQTAKQLGLSRRSLVEKMTKYELR